MTPEEARERWNKDPEYRKQVLRELEASHPVKFSKNEFGDIVF